MGKRCLTLWRLSVLRLALQLPFTRLGLVKVHVSGAGWDEIIRLKEQLENKQSALSGSKYSILPLHSMVPAAEQRKVFKRPPVGVRKIVLATNIAETVGPLMPPLPCLPSSVHAFCQPWTLCADIEVHQEKFPVHF